MPDDTVPRPPAEGSPAPVPADPRPPRDAPGVSQTFDPAAWESVAGFELTDVTYHRCVRPGPERGTVRVAFDRPEVRNAFRPHTVDELHR
ncbi:MAG TPA: hypothetical protein VFR07_00790, partial [Mycobacteriales bacterium]|nr:hypothetical protein [Mycobacteriales bacterium]